ncbi:hypothetical protein Hanom_Chr14g01249641 [Helianthus anomalus]
MIDDVEENVYNNGPFSNNENGNENEQKHKQTIPTKDINVLSLDDYSIPPVDHTKRTTTALEDEGEHCIMPTDDMLDLSIDMLETSQLNLAVGFGTQTQKLLDYCNTHVQLTPGITYDSKQQQTQLRETSNINKQV